MCESEARDVDYTQVIGRNVILYGESGTGKSTIILDLLYSIKDKVPSCFVISPTE
jgi:DNA replication protein DnaC